MLRETEPELQETAYDAIHSISDGTSPPYSNKIFNRDTDVDWARLEPYQEAADGSKLPVKLYLLESLEWRNFPRKPMRFPNVSVT